jgi:hypothetical protein
MGANVASAMVAYNRLDLCQQTPVAFKMNIVPEIIQKKKFH